MATTVADADALIAAVDAAAVTLSYVHRLYSPAVQYARSCLDRGDIGLPQSLHLSFVSTGSVTSGAVEDFRLVVDPGLSGGGELMNFLGYPVDTVRYLTGQDVTRVYVSAGTYFFAPHRAHGVEDFGVVFLTLERGIIATVVVGRAPTPNHPTGGDYTLRLHGTAGTVIVDENRPVVTIYAEPPAPASRSGQSLAQTTIAPLVDEFMAWIREDRRPLRTMHDGRAIVAVIEAAYRSLASGRVESVAPREPPAQGGREGGDEPQAVAIR
jgi:predicted dehydrogenase